MTSIKRKWDLLTDDERISLRDSFMYFFRNETGDDIGIIGADSFLDFFLESSAEVIYNKGIEDAKNIFKEKMLDLEVDLDLKKL